MEFVQIVEFTTSRIDDVRARAEKFREGAGSQGATNPPRVMMCADRDNPNRFMVIAEFADYETAMENSNRPEVNEFANDMAALCDGPPTFHNLDVAERM